MTQLADNVQNQKVTLGLNEIGSDDGLASGSSAQGQIPPSSSNAGDVNAVKKVKKKPTSRRMIPSSLLAGVDAMSSSR